MGSWIGGDRDGNPFVIAEVTAPGAGDAEPARARLPSRGAARAGRANCRSTAAWSTCPAALQALADASPDKAPERQDEPYRRALTGVYARLAATAWSSTGWSRRIRRSATAPPYARAAELKADLDVIHDSLDANNPAGLARGRLRALLRAVDVFGFHLASLDMRQNSDVHERVMAELFDDRRRVRGLCADGRGGARDAARWPSWQTRGRSARRIATTARRPPTSWRCCAPRPRRSAATAPRRVPTYVISKTDSVSDILEVGGAAEGGRACCGRGEGRARASSSRRCSRPSPTCSTAAEIMDALFAVPA